MIRIFALICAALLCLSCHSAEPKEGDGFDFQSIEVSAAISLYLKEISKQPYMLCNDVLTDTRKVSIRASGKTLTGPLFDSLLADHGFEAIEQRGVLVVCKKANEAADHPEPFLYKVKHRDPAYLIDLLSPLVKGAFANKRISSGAALTVGGNKIGGSDNASQPALLNTSYKASLDDDFIIFVGSTNEVEKLSNLLAQIDVPSGEVVIKAFMYEVGSSDDKSSSLGLVLSALGGRLGAEIGTNTLGNFLNLKTTSIDLVASALKSDSRFKIVTSPYQRVRSGKTARFVSGSQVSILGAIVNNQNGSTQQSFDRVESGTILEISPTVRADAIDLDLFQQVSSFVNVGGTSQPTLNKRELRTSLTVGDGEVVVIAGLEDSKQDNSNSGLPFLPFSLTKSRSFSKSQLVLVLEVTKVVRTH
jgi:type II secretory pathway component GspD/PulD (secretin)